MSQACAPGAALLHPIAPFSLLVLLLNDHWLKHTHPGWLSGKLSDFATMLLLPVLLHALFELGYAFTKGHAPPPLLSNRALLASIALSSLVFGLPEIWKPAETAYCYGMAGLRWPFRACAAVLTGHALPALRRCAATADPSDLLALSSAYVAWRIAHRGSATRAPRRARGAHALLGALIVLLTSSYSAPASASGSRPYEHDGFFIDFAFGPELIWVHSPASASNGFRQPIASTATGLARGGLLELGGTLRGLGLVLGGGIGYAQADDPIVSTLGRRFELSGAQLSVLSLEAFTKYYPNPRSGLHLGGSVLFTGVEVSGGSGQQVRGPGLSLEAGHGFWIARQWSLGLDARLMAAGLFGADVRGTTVLLMPGVFATIACH
jgi:hypothetical protein